MINLFGMNKVELQQLCTDEGLPRFAAKQMADWLYAKHVITLDAMTNLSLKVRSRLSEICIIDRSSPVDCQTSVDGTKKYLFHVDPTTDDWDAHAFVEAVFIPDDDRGTLCISCQRGCKMGCKFCVTGQQGFHGNLSASQILNQIFSVPEFDRLTNIVFMGMGEPMDNLDNVLRAIEVLTSDWGLGWSPHRITVSSVGILPGIRRYLDECGCHLAVSLHDPYPDGRLKMMPMEKAYPVAETIDMLKQYDWSGQRRVSFEYTMFKGINDDLNHAAELCRLLDGLRCRVNLIRYHASPDMPYATSGADTIQHFQDYLNRHGVTCTLRASRGEDIMAACGLLAGQHRN